MAKRAAALTTVLTGAAVAKVAVTGAALAAKATVAKQKGGSRGRQLLVKKLKSKATLVKRADLSGHDH